MLVYRVQTTDLTNILSYTTSGIAPAPHQSIRSSHDIPVKETSRPDLAGYEGTSQDSDKKPNDIEAGSIVNGTSKSGRYGTKQQSPHKHKTRAKPIAQRTRYEAEKKSGSERDDIGVGHLVLRKMQIFLDGQR